MQNYFANINIILMLAINYRRYVVTILVFYNIMLKLSYFIRIYTNTQLAIIAI